MATSAGDNMASIEGDMIATEATSSTVNGETAAVLAAPPVANGHISASGLEPSVAESYAPLTNGHTPADKEPIHMDAVVVGTGFSGIKAIYRLRKLGMTVRAFEAGSDFGGVWCWNRYPGARVDSETPFYQLNIPEVWRTWNFTERFPGHVELRRYFAHIEKTLNLKKDVEFNARVIDASYSIETGRWTLKTDAGHTATCKYLILATGLLHRRFIPDFAGLGSYEGQVIHSGFWPEATDLKGKKVALIGAGATAIQITQELGKQAKNLTVFLRRPSYCLPMKQRPWSELEGNGWKAFLSRLFEQGRLSRAGMPNSGPTCGVFDVTKEERETWFEEIWARGAFNFQMCNYNDVLLDRKANREVYGFWAKKTRERLSDPLKRDIMAPIEPPYLFGTKRNPLEMDYYEVLSQENVDIVDLSKTPLKIFEPKGMLMSDDKLREFDAVVLATGFDSFTGSLTNMGLKNKHGVDIKEVWRDGIWTHLGMMVSGFPNMFMTYSPQAPTALSNGPTILEAQVDWVVDSIAKLESENAKSLEPLHSAEIEWKTLITTMNDYTLFPFTSSWWTGGNVPGKKAEPMTYIGGIDNYEKQCRAAMDGWQGFEVVANSNNADADATVVGQEVNAREVTPDTSGHELQGANLTTTTTKNGIPQKEEGKMDRTHVDVVALQEVDV